MAQSECIRPIAPLPAAVLAGSQEPARSQSNLSHPLTEVEIAQHQHQPANKTIVGGAARTGQSGYPRFCHRAAPLLFVHVLLKEHGQAKSAYNQRAASIYR